LESDEFRRQSLDFARTWQGRGLACAHAEIEAADHFTALDRLFATESPLLDALLA
jgi:hypothetical protein